MAQTALQVVVEVETVPLGILVAQTVVVEVGTVEWGAPFGILVAPVLPGMLELAVQPAAAVAAQIAAAAAAVKPAAVKPAAQIAEV